MGTNKRRLASPPVSSSSMNIKTFAAAVRAQMLLKTNVPDLVSVSMHRFLGSRRVVFAALGGLGVAVAASAFTIYSWLSRRKKRIMPPVDYSDAGSKLENDTTAQIQLEEPTSSVPISEQDNNQQNNVQQKKHETGNIVGAQQSQSKQDTKAAHLPAAKANTDTDEHLQQPVVNDAKVNDTSDVRLSKVTFANSGEKQAEQSDIFFSEKPSASVDVNNIVSRPYENGIALPYAETNGEFGGLPRHHAGSSMSSEEKARGGSKKAPGLYGDIEPPPIYEFEIPQSIVGCVIGTKGVVIKDLTERSGAFILIRPHHFKDNYKICSIEGTREQINKCLQMIRRRFPPSRFPELNLNPVLPPPIASPNAGMWGSMIQLSLPEDVGCEVVLSSMVDAGHLFVQQPTHPSFPSLARLDQYMLAVYSQPGGVPELPRPLEIGVICAAPVLGGWFRALTVANYGDTDEALVKFVDYGGYSRLPFSDLRQIRDFMTLPFQATECYLANVKPVDESEGWSQAANELLEDLARGKIMEVRVHRLASDSLPYVHLYSPSPAQQPVHINRILSDKGFARWIRDEPKAQGRTMGKATIVAE